MSRIEGTPPRAVYTPTPEGRWRRRLISISLYTGLWLALTALSPLAVVIALLVGLVRQVKFAEVRVLGFFWLYLTCELLGIATSLLLWLARLLRPGLDEERYQSWHFGLQRWWAGTLWRGVCVLFSLDIHATGAEHTASGPYLLLIRHASVADTLLASAFIGVPFHMHLRYVLKRELLWDPCLDVVGHRIPNAFIKRGADDASETITIIKALATDLNEREGVLIYPEGTRFTRKKRQRVIEKLEQKIAGFDESQSADKAASTETLALANELTHTLPPRPKGTLALFETQPDADVVICAHAGFEKVTSFWHLWRGAPIHQAIHIHFWRFPAAEIPNDEDGQIQWLNDRWREVNAWVAERTP